MSYRASVIVPVYQAEKTLRRCVESLVLGRERNIEVILAEDCSADGSWAVCQELAREFDNVKCVRNPENRGVSHTRNRGLEEAQGTYILFADSDDWVSGDYVWQLLGAAEEYTDAMALCGFRFYEENEGYQRDYVWSDGNEQHCLVARRDFFELHGKVLLQSPCNKAFRRSVVEENHIRFDERQSMGEDFQFVLDYLEAAGTQRCVVINRALYHYIRATNTSLMSRFGLVEHHNEFDRFARLKRICGGDDAVVQTRYANAVDGLKKSYVYHAMHAGHLSKPEKLDLIRELMGTENADKVYDQHVLLMVKERIAKLLAACARLPGRAVGRVRRTWVKASVKHHLAGLDGDLTVISQNCIGGVLYHDLGAGFRSPTVNTYIQGPDFVRMVLDLRRYMDQDMVMRWEEYPVGRLGDIEIHFMHYGTCKEAKESWERRKARIDYGRILVLATDRDGFDEPVYAMWQRIPYPKVLFTANARFTKDAVFFPEFEDCGAVDDLISKRLFYRDGFLRKQIGCVIHNRRGG